MDDKESLEAEFRTLEERHLRPEIRKSIEKLDALLADDFVEFGSSGNIYTKPQVLDAVPLSSLGSAVLSGFQVKQLAPDLVLAFYQLAAQNDHNPEMSYSLRSSIWKRFQGGWQMVFHQGTPFGEHG